MELVKWGQMRQTRIEVKLLRMKNKWQMMKMNKMEAINLFTNLSTYFTLYFFHFDMNYGN